MRVLVCGGRDYDNRELVFRVLDRLHRWRKIECIIHGGADGADCLADKWASSTPLVDVSVYEAEWSKYGLAAGAKRNERMLLDGKPDLVVAFPGGRGTKDMVDRARKITAVVTIAPNGHRATYLAPDLQTAVFAKKCSCVVLGDKRP